MGKRVQGQDPVKKEKGSWIFWVGLLLSGIVVIATGVFLWQIWKTQFVPEQWMLYLCLGMAVLLLLAVWLLNQRKTGRFVLGAVLALAMIAAMVVGGKMVQEGVEALERITTAEGEIEYVGIYVPKEDPIEYLEDAAGYNFGIWSSMDAQLSEKVVNTINDTLKTSIATTSYATLPELLDALYAGAVDAIIFPDAFFDLLEDMEGYGDVEEKIRPLITLDFESETGELEKPVLPDHTFAVYISGIDSRNGLLAKSRSDVNIIAYVNTKTHQVLLISTPRDYYVPLSISNGARDKLTHAGIYGVKVSKDTIAMLYDVDIEYYFRVNFQGFEKIIDSLGGVNVYSAYAFNSRGVTIHEGMNELNGAEALAFARERYSLPGGDRERGKNQMAVIQAVIDKAMSPEILKNYSSVLQAVEGNFETTVPYELIANLVRDQLDEGGDWDVMTYSVDGTGDSQIPYSMSTYAYVMWPKEETVQKAQALIDAMENNEIITQP